MVFTINDELWKLITCCYEIGGKSLSSTTRIMIEDLLISLQTCRTIMSSYEANLIVTLLLSAVQSQRDILDAEDERHTHRQAKDNWYEESVTLISKITQVVEQLRLFSKAMETCSLDRSMEQSR